MLDIAAKKGLYHKLIKTDIVDFLAKNNFKYDFIVASDVFEYVPDIKSMVSHLNGASLIFNIEKAIDNVNDYMLSFSGRFQHNPDYVTAILTDAGYTNIKTYDINLRQENAEPVEGVLFIAHF